MTKTVNLLPTNDAIMLYAFREIGGIALNDYCKIVKKMSLPAQDIASKMQNNKNPNYKKPIPACTDMKRYNEAVKNIAAILKAVHKYNGGNEAVMGYLKYIGPLNQSGGFRKSY